MQPIPFFAVPLVMLAMLFCPSCADITEIYHESNASAFYLQGNFDKMPPAIEQAAKQLGLSLNQTDKSTDGGCFQGDTVRISYKKEYGDNIKLYIKFNTAGNIEQEKKIYYMIKTCFEAGV